MAKYVCFKDDEGRESIVVFPEQFVHSDVSDAMVRMRKGFGRSMERYNLRPVSAGFVGVDGECYGKSESLRLSSRPEDTAILRGQR